MTEQQYPKMLPAPEEDSDSDGGVLLCDFHDSVRYHKHKLSEAVAQFTFAMLLPKAPFPANLVLICTKVKKHPPHDHTISSAHSLAFDASRCYAVLENSHRGLSEDKTLPGSVTEVTNFLSQLTFSGRAGSHPVNRDRESNDSEHGIRELTPRQIQLALHHWTVGDPVFVRNCRIKDVRNHSYPGIDMNFGWNRARFGTKNRILESEGTAKERKAIEEGFQCFSFTMQTKPLVFPMAWADMFAIVLVGSGSGKSVWCRQPGSWWAARKGVFVSGRWCDFVARLKRTIREIERKVDTWREEAGWVGSDVRRLKRKWSMAGANKDDNDTLQNGGKKGRGTQTKSEEVMGEEWRVKRRLQEKHAGRWTDGSLRMDRLWAGFHWLLNDLDY